MYLSVVKMVGDCAFGWDGYGEWVPGITLDPYRASRVRQELCYVRSVSITV